MRDHETVEENNEAPKLLKAPVVGKEKKRSTDEEDKLMRKERHQHK